MAESADAARVEDQAGAVLDHLVEGTIVVDRDRTVRWLNAAARRMLPSIEHPIGRPLLEVIRDHRLDALADRARSSGEEQMIEIEKTKRRSNAIENVLIPRLQSNARYIKFRFDEMERESFTKLKTVKRKIAQREAE